MSNLTPAGESTRRLYVRYAGVSSVAGAEILLLWAPGGNEDPAYAAVNFGAPAAATCTWLLRGSVLNIQEQSDSTMRIAATGTVNTSCSAGNVFYVDFAEAVADSIPPGRFALAYALVIDANGDTDALALGPAATILNGGVSPAPRLLGFAPQAGYTNFSVTHRIAAQNLVAPVAVSLVRPDGTQLAGSATLTSPTLLSVVFTFAAGDTGFRKLRLSNSGGRFSGPAEPILVSTLPPAGSGISAGGYDRLIVTVRPGALGLTGGAPVATSRLTTGDLSLRQALTAAGARTLKCLWPELTPHPLTVTTREGRVDSLVDLSRSYEVAFDNNERAREAIGVLRASPAVSTVNPSYVISGIDACNINGLSCGSTSSPADVDFGRQWYLRQTDMHARVLEGREGMDLETPCVWSLERPVARGTRSVILGLLDSGIDATHPDLARTYSTPGYGQRILTGFNGFDGSTNIVDDHGHGTMMAGVAAARTGDGTAWIDDQGFSRGIAGVAGGWAESSLDSAGVRILPVKMLDFENNGTLGSFVSGLNWAVLNGARIINMSFTLPVEGPPEAIDPALRGALYNALLQGATCIAGSGNSGDSTAFYPVQFARWGLCIAVGGIDACGWRADLGPNGASSYGSHLDVVAPSTNIFTTYPLSGGSIPAASGYIESRFGTSFSTALVSGVAASLKSINPALSDVDIKHILRESAINDYGQPYVEVGKGRVAHRAAVRLMDPALGQALIDGTAITPTSIDSASAILTIKSSDIAGVPDGTYTTAKRYDLNYNVTFPVQFTSGPGVPPPIAWVRVAGTKGWTHDSPHLFNYGGGQVTALSTTGATLRTTVYRLPSLGNRFVPNTLSEARVSYRALGKQTGTTGAPSLVIGDGVTLRAIGSPTRQVSGMTLEFSGRPGVPVRFALYEVRGRKLADMDLVPDATGVIRTRWPSLHPLPPGLYFVRASQGDASKVARIVLAGGGTP